MRLQLAPASPSQQVRPRCIRSRASFDLLHYPTIHFGFIGSGQAPACAHAVAHSHIGGTAALSVARW